MRGLSNQIERTVAELMAIGKAVILARSICMGFGISLLMLGVWPARATATPRTDIVVSTENPGFQSAGLGRTGTFRLLAFSQQSQQLMVLPDGSVVVVSPPIGPNGTSTITTVLGGVRGTLTPTVESGFGIIVPTNVTGPNDVANLYGPTAKDKENLRKKSIPFGPPIIGTPGPSPLKNPPPGAGELRKSIFSLPGDNVLVKSTSGIWLGQAAAGFITKNNVREIAAETLLLGNPGPSGKAAGRAVDPFQVPSGSLFSYDPTVSARVELGSPNVSGGIGAFAVDSSVFTADSLDRFEDNGSPLDQTLWYVSVSGQIAGGEIIVLVDFQLNPLALNEIQFPSSFLASLGPYTDAASEAVLIDEAIAKFITSRLALEGNVVELNEVRLFPAGTTFQAIEGGVDYAEGVDAVVTAVPEPGTLWLFGIGLAALALSGILFRISPNWR